MAKLVSLTYIGPSAEVSIPALGITVQRGTPIKVTADIAGRPATVDADGHVRDLGEGLLAQGDIWTTAQLEG